MTAVERRDYYSCATGSVVYQMLKLSKKADYALIAVRHLASHGADRSQSASDIAEAYGISATLLAKVLQLSLIHI